MEKKGYHPHRKSIKHKLPTLTNNKSHLNLSSKAPQITIKPSEHLQELRKLYYQYKSNANILTSSPYYTNRQQQNKVVSYIQANKCQPTSEQIQKIEDRYSITEELLDKSKERPSQTVNVKLHCFNVVL